LSWDPFSSTIFEIHFSDELWGMMEEYLLMWKASEAPPKACDPTASIKELAEKLADDVTKVEDPVSSIWAPED
jgi:hypothetical protein